MCMFLNGLNFLLHSSVHLMFHWLSNTVEQSSRRSRNYTPFVKAIGSTTFSQQIAVGQSLKTDEASEYYCPKFLLIVILQASVCRSHWSRGLRHGSAATRLLRLRVRIPPGAWMSVSCECCVLSDRGLCGGLITRPEESYRGGCVWVWSLSFGSEKRPWPTISCCAI